MIFNWGESFVVLGYQSYGFHCYLRKIGRTAEIVNGD